MSRIPVFAGLGSDVLFDVGTQQQAITDSRSAAGQVLLTACQQIFLEEINLAENDSALGIDEGDFQRPQDIIDPCQRYHQHPVVQHATLCLIQLLRYQSQQREHFTSNAQELVATSGFCAGLFAAVAVATARNSLQFLVRAEECFRAAVLLGVACDRSRRKLRSLYSNAPWSIIVGNVEKEEISEIISAYNASHNLRTPIYISSLNSKTCVTISSEGEALHDFAETMLPTRSKIKPTNLFTLYHERSQLIEYRDQLLKEFATRQLPFPNRKDLLVPLISTVDGSLISAHNNGCPTDLLQDILGMILTEITDWSATQETIVLLGREARRHIDRPFLVCNYGPDYGALNGRRDLNPDIQVCDNSLDLRVDEAEDSDIAIVGVGVDLPGAPDFETLWQNLMDGLNTCSEIPSERFHVEDYYSQHGCKPLREQRALGTRYGNFLEDPFTFDNQLFGISPREALSIDPQQRLMLQTVYRALEHAGYVPDATPTFSRETFGCFVGNATLDYVDNLRNSIDVYYSPGTLRAFLSGRISYAFKWSGPSMTVDTACSSSLVALHQAARALVAGDCRAAVAGGVNVITSPDMYLGLDKAHFLSPTGQCKAFDQSADGYCRSEGCTAFVLKRLTDAISENDRILGVIKGIAVNQSGQTSSITHPHSPTQEKLFRRLLLQARLRPQDVTVAEAHGTGTQAGDPKELKSIRKVFCEGRATDNPLHITSIKSNIGHCEAASGGASLAKLLLMLKHKVVPPQQLLDILNPAIDDLGIDGALISAEALEWTQPHGKRTALLNNFGAAGSNAALLLQEHCQSSAEQRAHTTQVTHVFGCSARDVELLEQMRGNLVAYMAIHADELAIEDVCYTSTARRGLHKYRLSCKASSIEELIRNLAQAPIAEVPNHPRGNVFLFSGQGSQYLGMGRDLFDQCPKFRTTVKRCHQLLVGWGFPGCLEVMQPDAVYPPNPNEPKTLEAFQSGVFVLEVAISQLLIDLGIRPSMVIGHSLGEYAALVIAGVLDLESGLWLVAERAHLLVSHCQLWETSMLAVNMDSVQVRKELLSQRGFEALTISCENSPMNCVVGGEKQALHRLREFLSRELGKRCAMLDVPLAYHTAAVDPIMNKLKEKASQVHLAPPSIPIASNVFGKVVQPGEEAFTPEYFANHCRQTVAFDSGVAEILKQDSNFESAHWVEIGPHPTILPMITTRLSNGTAVKLSVLKKEQQASQTLSEVFAAFYLNDFGAVDWRKVFENTRSKPSIMDLPPAPMKREKYYVPFTRELPQEQQSIAKIQFRGTDFTVLHSHVESDGDAIAVFETPIATLTNLIRGHIVCGHALCPASVYSEMALAAITHLQGRESQNRAFKLSKLVFSRPLLFSEGSPVAVKISLSEGNMSDGDLKFDISSFVTDDTHSKQKTHCSGDIKLSKTTKNLVSTERALARRKTEFQNGEYQTFSANTMYNKIFSRVVEYSSNYRAVKKLYMDDEAEEIFAICQLPDAGGDARYAGQPILLDTMLHVAGFAANLNADNHTVCICHQVHSTTILRTDVHTVRTFEVHCSNFTSATDPHTVVADVHAVDQHGIIAIVKGIEFRRTEMSKIQAAFELAARDRLEVDISPRHPINEQIRITLDRVESNSSQGGDTASSGELSAALEPPSPAISILSETTGINARDLTSQTDFDSIGVDSMMIFELEKKLEKAMDQKPSVLELSAIRTVGEFEKLTSARPSRSGTPALKVDTPRRTPRRVTSYEIRDSDERVKPSQISMDQPTVRSKSGVKNPPNEAEITQEMVELIRSRLDLDEQPERIQKSHSIARLAPLYLIHPGAGMCHEYRRIGSLNRAVHAIHDPCIFSEQKSDWVSIEDMAEYYSDVIRRDLSSSTTPGIILGGYSFGGVLAFEVARLLAERDQCIVRGVILIDAPPALNHVPLSRETIEAAMADKHSHRSIARSREVADFEAAIGSLAIRNNLRRAALLGKYKPRRKGPMPRVILLRSSEGFKVDNGHLPDNRWLHDRRDVMTSVQSWEELTGANVEVIDIPGDHFTPFEPKNVQATSSAIRQACLMFDE